MTESSITWELVACLDRLGEFSIEDGEDTLLDCALPQFILEVCDVTIPSSERRSLRNNGWERMTTKKCIAMLESAGVVQTR